MGNVLPFLLTSIAGTLRLCYITNPNGLVPAGEKSRVPLTESWRRDILYFARGVQTLRVWNLEN